MKKTFFRYFLHEYVSQNSTFVPAQFGCASSLSQKAGISGFSEHEVAGIGLHSNMLAVASKRTEIKYEQKAGVTSVAAQIAERSKQPFRRENGGSCGTSNSTLCS